MKPIEFLIPPLLRRFGRFSLDSSVLAWHPESSTFSVRKRPRSNWPLSRLLKVLCSRTLELGEERNARPNYEDETQPPGPHPAPSWPFLALIYWRQFLRVPVPPVLGAVELPIRMMAFRNSFGTQVNLGMLGKGSKSRSSRTTEDGLDYDIAFKDA